MKIEFKDVEDALKDAHNNGYCRGYEVLRRAILEAVTCKEIQKSIEVHREQSWQDWKENYIKSQEQKR